MRILITGGAGFIGSHIAEYYNGRAEVRILDNLRSGSMKNLEGFKEYPVDCFYVNETEVNKPNWTEGFCIARWID